MEGYNRLPRNRPAHSNTSVNSKLIKAEEKFKKFQIRRGLCYDEDIESPKCETKSLRVTKPPQCDTKSQKYGTKSPQSRSKYADNSVLYQTNSLSLEDTTSSASISQAWSGEIGYSEFNNNLNQESISTELRTNRENYQPNSIVKSVGNPVQVNRENSSTKSFCSNVKDKTDKTNESNKAKNKATSIEAIETGDANFTGQSIEIHFANSFKKYGENSKENHIDENKKSNASSTEKEMETFEANVRLSNCKTSEAIVQDNIYIFADANLENKEANFTANSKNNDVNVNKANIQMSNGSSSEPNVENTFVNFNTASRENNKTTAYTECMHTSYASTNEANRDKIKSNFNPTDMGNNKANTCEGKVEKNNLKLPDAIEDHNTVSSLETNIATQVPNEICNKYHCDFLFWCKTCEIYFCKKCVWNHRKCNWSFLERSHPMSHLVLSRIFLDNKDLIPDANINLSNLRKLSFDLNELRQSMLQKQIEIDEHESAMKLQPTHHPNNDFSDIPKAVYQNDEIGKISSTGSRHSSLLLHIAAAYEVWYFFMKQ